MEKKDYRWLPAHMPTVAEIVADMRTRWGAEWVAQCWATGVVQRLPGHFWAAEGALTVGTPTPRQLLDWYDPEPGAERPHAVLCMPEPQTQPGAGDAGA